MKTDFQNEKFIKAFLDRSLGYYENTIEISNDFDYAEDITDIAQSMQWIIKYDIPLFSIKENASGRKVLDSESCWILDKIKPYLIFDPSCIADGIVKSFFANQIAKSFPMHIFNPYVELFFRYLNDKLVGQIDLYNYLFNHYRNDEVLKTVDDIINDFISGIRNEGKSKPFKLILSDYKRLPQKNYQGLMDDTEKVFRRYESFTAFRIDLSYEKEKFDHPVNENDRIQMYYQAIGDLELFLKNMRTNPQFKLMIYPVWKLECGLQKGIHIQCLFFFNRSQDKANINMPTLVGEYWNTITDGKGLYHICNTYETMYNKPGINYMNYGNTALRVKLEEVASYLTKTDYYARMIAPDNGPTFGKGEIKASNWVRPQDLVAKFISVGDNRPFLVFTKSDD